ncbi:hypothetical protein BDZ89DRAFT_758493 [Hymenopellis radicata]|nr:hypothetical protein BDZ89DRAFT_758493 [Hymenopellis radicata]
MARDFAEDDMLESFEDSDLSWTYIFGFLRTFRLVIVYFRFVCIGLLLRRRFKAAGFCRNDLRLAADALALCSQRYSTCATQGCLALAETGLRFTQRSSTSDVPSKRLNPSRILT